MHNASHFDRHSDRCGRGAWLVPLVLVPVCFLLSFVYTWTLFRIPAIAHLSLLLAIGVGAGVGSVAGRLLYRTHVRNTVLCVVVGVCAGVMALYLRWVFLVFMTIAETEPEAGIRFTAVLCRPVGVVRALLELYRDQWAHAGVQGGMIMRFLAAAEALAIIGLPVLLARRKIANAAAREADDDSGSA